MGKIGGLGGYCSAGLGSVVSQERRPALRKFFALRKTPGIVPGVFAIQGLLIYSVVLRALRLQAGCLYQRLL